MIHDPVFGASEDGPWPAEEPSGCLAFIVRLILLVGVAALLVACTAMLVGCGADDRVTVTAGPSTTVARPDGLAGPLEPAEAAFADGWRPPPPSPPTTVVERRAHLRRPVSRASRSRPAPTPAGGTLACIRAGESGGNYRAVSPSGRYRGAYQFDAGTWRALGGSGDPAAAPPAEQDARAAELYRQRGTQPWPNRGRCG